MPAHELKRITYVEDEPDIRAVTEMALSALGGFELDVYERGEDAVAGAAAFGPDLILLDVMMPGMDGLEVMERFSKIDGLRDRPVVFMTAKTRKMEMDEYMALGAVSVIPKPFDPMTLVDELKEIWSDRCAVSA